MKIGFVSLGCCKNLVDSEQIMGMIKRGGHEIVANPKDAQAIIVNTCGLGVMKVDLSILQLQIHI